MNLMNNISNFNISKIKGYNRIILLNTMGMVLCKIFSVCITFVLFPLYIDFFGNNEILGVWFTLLSVLNWVLLFDLGLGNGLRNKLPEALASNDIVLAKKYISTTYISSSIFALLVFVLICFISNKVNWNELLNVGLATINNEVLRSCVMITLSGICIQFVIKLITSILYALQKSACVNFIGVISNVIILLSLLLIHRGSLEENLILMSYINVMAINLPMLLFSIYVFKTSLNQMQPNMKMFEVGLCKDLLGIGLTLLWLQIIFLVVANSNEFLITYLTTPDNVVPYQAYMKIYNTGAVIFSFALTPLWSAVTKAKSEKNYSWIIKAYKFFGMMSALCFMIELIVSLFGQCIFELWLGKSVMNFNIVYGIVFSVHSYIFIIHNINTSISNGLSYFRFQIIGMSLAALLHIPIAILFVDICDSWIGVIIASCVAMSFYELFAPYFTVKYIREL